MKSTLKSSSQRIQELLNNHHIALQVIEFPELTRTSQEAAQAIGCEIGQIAKTLIFRTKLSGKACCVIASGKNRVNEQIVAEHIGEEIEKPDAKFVQKVTGFAIGGVPPIGYELEIQILVDEDLAVYTEIWAAAGTPYSVFKLTFQDLLQLTHGIVVNMRLEN